MQTKLKSKQIGSININKLFSTSSSITAKYIVWNDEIQRFEMSDELTTLINNKVDKEAGKTLTANDFTIAYKNKLDSLQNYDDTDIQQRVNTLEHTIEDNYYTSNTIDTLLTNKVNNSTLVNYVTSSAFNTALANKVDKITGKGLSTNDYTTAEKTRLSTITTTGNGQSYLANDGTYKVISGGIDSKTKSERISMTGLSDGKIIYQNNEGKGMYLYSNSTWLYQGDPIENKEITSNYTLNIDDIGFNLNVNSINNLEILIPNGVFKKGHTIILTQTNVGRFEIKPATGITLNYPATFSTISYEQYAQVRIRFTTDTIAILDGLTI